MGAEAEKRGIVFVRVNAMRVIVNLRGPGFASHGVAGDVNVFASAAFFGHYALHHHTHFGHSMRVENPLRLRVTWRVHAPRPEAVPKPPNADEPESLRWR